MKKAAVILIPVVLFTAAIWLIIRGIEPMVERENNNRMHAMLLGCSYVGTLNDQSSILIFNCDSKIELHMAIEW